MSALFSGLEVVELGEGLSVAYCGKLLADYGAHVVKVETPAGDPLRGGLSEGAATSAAEGGLWSFLNTSKKSVTIDESTEGGIALLKGLIDRSDVVVNSLAVARRASMGLGTAAVAEKGIIEVSLTPFGLSGPYSDYLAEPLTLAAIAGGMLTMGDEDKPPLFAGQPYTAFMAGIAGATGALIALEGRDDDKAGDVVEVSEFELAVSCGPGRSAVAFGYSGKEIRGRHGAFSKGDPMVALYPCKDGYVMLQSLHKASDMLHFVGGEELEGDERFHTVEARGENRAALAAIISDALKTQSRWEVFERGSQQRLLFGAVPDVAELLTLKPHVERGYFQTDPNGSLAGVRVPGAPIRFADGDWQSRPAPRLGEDNELILSNLSISTGATLPGESTDDR